MDLYARKDFLEITMLDGDSVGYLEFYYLFVAKVY